MNHPNKSHDTLVYRLSQVLQKLNQGESLDPQQLADEFGVNLRTIQRDLNVRFVSLPLIKTAGRYRMEAAHLGKLTLKDIEKFAHLSGVIWLGATRQRVLLRVAGAVAGYFKRRQLIANQLIEREFDNGDILVSCKCRMRRQTSP